jgi:hypothetical protein
MRKFILSKGVVHKWRQGLMRIGSEFLWRQYLDFSNKNRTIGVGDLKNIDVIHGRAQIMKIFVPESKISTKIS